MDEASCCQSECQAEKSVSPQALEGMLPGRSPDQSAMDCTRRTGMRSSPRARRTCCLDQTLLPGRSPFFAVAPGGFERALTLASGSAAQPRSHDGQPVKEELLIRAFAPVWSPNGASPEAW